MKLHMRLVLSSRSLAAGLMHLHKLRELRLHQNDIGCEGMVSLKRGIRELTNLRKLSLIKTGIELKGSVALGQALRSCQRLTTLAISQVEEGIGTCAVLSRLYHLQSLRELTIDNVPLDNTADMQKLSDALSPLTTLCSVKV